MVKSRKKIGKSFPGISRIDQSVKHNHGYYVRLTRNGKNFAKFFPDKKCNDKGNALLAAQSFHAGLSSKNPPMPRKKFAQIKRRFSKKGIVGVSKIIKEVKGRNYKFWQATWSPKVGTVQKQAYSIKKFGEIKAKELAIKARNKGVRGMAD